MTFVRLARTLIMLSLAAAATMPAVAQEGEPAAAAPMSKEQQAQMEAMQKAMTPGPAHKQLGELAGDWTFTTKMWMDPSAPPSELPGTTTYRMILGGRYLQGDHRGTFQGMPFEGHSVMAFDNVSRKYYASWIDNMGTGLMFFAGTYDAAKKAYTLLSDMQDPMQPGTTIKVREVLTLVDANTHRMDWYQTQGGKETRTMEIVYTRKK